MTQTTTSVGGTRTVPVPDPVATDYLRLALRLDQHIPGLVDGYFGPADLKAATDLEALRPPEQLADDAAALRARLPAEIGGDGQRLDWLDAQLVALETQARSLAGWSLSYLDRVERLFTRRPRRREEQLFDAAAAKLDRLVPGSGSLSERLAADDAAWTLPLEAAGTVIEALIRRFRERSAELFGLPDGEDLRWSLVTKQPWGAYNWYDGGLRSRIDVNTDLPLRLPVLAGTLAHETYPGHHLEHAWKEADLVERGGPVESSLLLINTPESMISEGLAEVGQGFVLPPDETAELLAELAGLAGLPFADDPPALADRAVGRAAVSAARKVLDQSILNAALLRHADGRSHEEVLAYLVEVGRFAPDVAPKRLEFIEHPLWRTYVFVYADGEALLSDWLDAVGPDERPTRFQRLLHEQLTPRAIAAELGASPA